jgi:predicted ATPase
VPSLSREALSRRNDAEADLLEAIEIAGRQKAKSLKLRAATSLARLRRDQGRRLEACNLLAPVYSWFTEGFDAPDLREAKALLDELR